MNFLWKSWNALFVEYTMPESWEIWISIHGICANVHGRNHFKFHVTFHCFNSLVYFMRIFIVAMTSHEHDNDMKWETIARDDLVWMRSWNFMCSNLNINMSATSSVLDACAASHKSINERTGVREPKVGKLRYAIYELPRIDCFQVPHVPDANSMQWNSIFKSNWF